MARVPRAVSGNGKQLYVHMGTVSVKVKNPHAKAKGLNTMMMVR